MARLIDGKATALAIKNEVKTQISALKDRGHSVCLATILVGDDPASHSYVSGKIKTCGEMGIMSRHFGMPKEISQADLLELINSLNHDSTVNGILVQLPLPDSIDESEIISSIDPRKDVDGFHPLSMGKLVLGEEGFVPCTPAGIIELLKRYGVETRGKNVVIVGRSNIVGKPLANLLIHKKGGADATVTICHSRTTNIKEHTLRADILVAAIGKAHLITSDMVKEGTVVIDVGTNEIGQTTDGKRILVGDVDFETVKDKASLITPVPGGVGPMTIAMLMKNTLLAAQTQTDLSHYCYVNYSQPSERNTAL